MLCFRSEGNLLQSYLDRQPDVEDLRPVVTRYLWNLACGLATNEKRKRTRRGDVSMPHDFEHAKAPSGEKAMLDRDLLARLDDCLRLRGSGLYLYYKLRYRDGHAPRDITAITGWSQKKTYKLKQALDDAVATCAKQLGVRHEQG